MALARRLGGSRASTFIGSLHATSRWGWQTAGLFFVLPGASVLLEPGIPFAGRLGSALSVAVGALLLLWRGWPRGVRRFGLLIPLVGAANLLWLNRLSGGQAFEVWELVLWYAVGITWIGLTQEARTLWLSPVFVVTFLLSTPGPWDVSRVVAAALTVGVMSAVASLVASDLSRGRRAYASMRNGVRHMTAVAQSGRMSNDQSPAEIYRATATTARELGFAGAGIAELVAARTTWEWRSWSGQVPLEQVSAKLTELMLDVAQDEEMRMIRHEDQGLLAAPLVGAEDVSYVLAATSMGPVEEEQLRAFELLAAQTGRGMQILQMAYYDTLTRLPNRSLFRDRLEEQLVQAQQDPTYHFALLYLDVDRFKAINDLYGHNVGDAFLEELAIRLRGCLRALDYISHPDDATTSRLGGDEFAVLLPGLGKTSDATRIAERLHAVLSQPVLIEDREVNTRPSIGIVLSSPKYTDPSEMMRDADKAMYQAKRSSQIRFAVFDDGMRKAVGRSLELERRLIDALDHGEMSVRYQPITRVETGEPVGFEALMRWHHPELGEIAAGEFIPIAEESGAIGSLTHWIVDEVCQNLPVWNARQPGHRPIYVAINLSRKQIGDLSLLDHLRASIGAAGIRPEQIVIEITESMAFLDPGLTRAFLEELRALGVRLALDDFGTGYTSLSCLHELPVQLLKIDREFVLAAREERAARALSGVVQMAHTMGLEVVAEGVEELEQLDLITAVGCDLVQGNIVSPPLPDFAPSIWLAEQPAAPAGRASPPPVATAVRS